MAETTTFLTKNDFIKLADFIIDTYEAAFVPEINFKEGKEIELKNLDEVLEHINEYPHQKAPALSYFIVSPQWKVEPIYFDFINNKFVGSHYSAIQRYGGPSIEITPRMFGLTNSFTDKIISGTIADYPYYISGSFLQDKINGYQTIDRPESLKKAMVGIKNYIKKNGCKVVYRNGITKVGYAMTDAVELNNKGIKLMQGDLSFEKE
jgi:hypothetical protein